MARQLLPKRRVPLRRGQEIERRDRYRVTRTGVWVDPYPEIPGTKPEKIVYAALRQLKIPFQFQEWFHVELADLEVAQWLRPDFILPDIRTVILVQGQYFHTRPDQIVKDSLQFALYQMMGWTVLAWWEFDIESDIWGLIGKEPRMMQLQGRGDPYPHQTKWYDDLKGLRKANQARRKPWTRKPVTLKMSRKSTKVKGLLN